MQTFRADNDNKHLYFRNFERRSDAEEFREVMAILTEKGCEIGNRTICPDCDLIQCKINGRPFSVYATIDGDGTFLCVEDEETLIILEELFKE